MKLGFDKLLHLLGGLVLGIILSRFGMTGVLLAALAIFGYELAQFITDTGAMELGDALFGFLGLIIAVGSFFWLRILTRKVKV